MSEPVRVAVATLGCKVNHYDSATIETRLRREGVEIVSFDATADVYVVNSCSVTDRADAESRQLARRARRRNAAARVVVTGCYAQTQPAAAAIAEVDHVVGLNRLDDLVATVRGERPDQRIQVDDLRTARRVETIGAEVFTGQTRAFLKVQEGCDLFCTFCIVPFARGKSRSVPPRAVLEQLHRLADLGFREVVLTGVHLGGYGHDLEAELGLTGLLELIAERAPIARIRLSSVDPPEVSDELLHLVRDSDVICEHLHIPIQSGSEAVLGRMRRKYGRAELDRLGERLARWLPDATIGTDVIAGFPGETAAEFEETVDALENLPISAFHVFPYSPRSGTTAAKRSDGLDATTIRARAQRLRAQGARKREAFAARFLGRELDVLVESGAAAAPGWASGYSRNYLRVALSADDSLRNCEVRVRITDQRGERLIGVSV